MKGVIKNINCNFGRIKYPVSTGILKGTTQTKSNTKRGTQIGVEISILNKKINIAPMDRNIPSANSRLNLDFNI